MAKAIFISEQWLKDNTPLPSNLDVKEIYPFYQVAQSKYIKYILQTPLYDRLSNGLINNTLTNDEIELLKVIRPCLGFYCVYESVPYIAVKIKNIGVVRTNDDKQTAGSNTDVLNLRDKALTDAEHYANELKQYLCNNRDKFPEYKPCLKEDTFTCDLYLDPYICNPVDEKFIKTYYRQ